MGVAETFEDFRTSLLRTAGEIQGWLAGLQIQQEWVEAEVNHGYLRFTFEHPRRGTVHVTEPLPENSRFQTQDIAFEVTSREGRRVRLRVYDFGGIWDPIDKRVMGEHYSASHFALLSAILFSETRNDAYLRQAEDAFEFHRYTSVDEYAFSEWMYHWDFQNYALAESFEILRTALDAPARSRWQNSLLHWRSNGRNKLTNWAAMRALAHLRRYHLFGRPVDMLRSKWDYYVALRGAHQNGCFDDEKNESRPIQYHVYTAALLHRIYLLSGRKDVLRRFLNGVEFFLPFIDPDGDFNYWGRGQEQIFGYAAGIYALVAAYVVTNDHKYGAAAIKLLDYVSRFQREGHFPLVLNDCDESERAGWYDYHHTTVYNAFLGAWLGLTYKLGLPAAGCKTVLPERSTPQPFFAILQNDDYFVAFGEGLPHYSTECGVSPCHLWVKDVGRLYSCPGGPTEETFGKFYRDGNVRWNFFAPLVVDRDGRVVSPGGRASRMTAESDSRVRYHLDCGIFDVFRRVNLSGGTLEIEDKVTFKRDMQCSEVRLFNLPLPESRFDVQMQSNELLILAQAGAVRILCETPADFGDFEAGERIETAVGRVRVIVRRVQNKPLTKGSVLKARTVLTQVAVDGTAASGSVASNRVHLET